MELLTKCPWCGYRHEVASAVGGDGPRKPDAGSISICIACGEVAVFELDFLGLRLREPTDEERASIEEDDTVRQVREAWRVVQARHPHSWPGKS